MKKVASAHLRTHPLGGTMALMSAGETTHTCTHILPLAAQAVCITAKQAFEVVLTLLVI